MVGDQNPFSDSSQSDDESNCDGDEVEDAEVNGEHERSGDEADAAVAFLRRQRQRRRALSMRILSRGADNDISPFLRRALSESVINARRRYTGRENSGYPNSHFSSLVRRRALLENARGNNNAGAVGASVRRYVYLSDGNRDNDSGDDSDRTGRRSANIDGTSRNRPLHISDLRFQVSNRVITKLLKTTLPTITTGTTTPMKAQFSRFRCQINNRMTNKLLKTNLPTITAGMKEFSMLLAGQRRSSGTFATASTVQTSKRSFKQARYCRCRLL